MFKHIVRKFTFSAVVVRIRYVTCSAIFSSAGCLSVYVSVSQIVTTTCGDF